MASTMPAHFQPKPEMVQLTQWGTARVPQGSAWMIFDVDSVAPNHTNLALRNAAWELRLTDQT
jgi:hypothetical protein